MALEAGERLAHYEILEPIGKGGMGEVYRARDTKLSRDVAVKLLPEETASDPTRVSRFKHEARAASALNHPNIVTIYQIEDDASPSFIVMELVEGATLRNRLEEGPLVGDELEHIARQLCEGLSKAHAAGVIHGDIKPDNIMVNRDGLVKILDFGLAQLLNVPDAVGHEEETVTKAAAVTGGTLSYLAPEQALGKPQDARSDVFSLGVVLYELCTGCKPFEGDTAAAVYDAILHQTPTSSGLPEAFTATILQCLNKSPEDRFDDAGDLLEALSDGGPLALDSDEIAIAVVPFKCLSSDEDTVFFGEGLTEDITLDLAKVGNLRVTSRTSALQLKSSEKDVRSQGRELGVRYVLEGSVRRASSGLRVTAGLVDVESDAHVWGERFGGTLDDIFAIQEDISRKIVKALRLTLTPAEDRALSERPFEDVRAYECYTRAHQELWRWSPEGLARSLRAIDDGLELVGDHELLFAAKGIIYWNYCAGAMLPRSESFDKAKQLCDRAFELGGRSSSSHFLRGALEIFGGSAHKAAHHLNRALEIQPDDRDALYWLCFVSGWGGRTQRARTLLARLMEIDPLTPANNWIVGALDMLEGRFDEGANGLQRFIDKDPEVYFPRYFKATILARAGRLDELQSLWESLRALQPDGMHAGISRVYEAAQHGDVEAVRAALTPELMELSTWHLGVAGDLATACALGRVTDEALKLLDRAIGLGWFNPEFWGKHDGTFAYLHGDKRFEEIVDKARLAAASFQS